MGVEPISSAFVVSTALTAARLAGMMGAAPMFGSVAVPWRARAAMALLLGAALSPTVIPSGLVASGVASGTFALMLVGEALIGVFIGVVAGLPIVALRAGGELASQQMAIGFASVYGGAEHADDAVRRAMWWIGIVAFLAIGGHEAVVTAVVGSYGRVPAGGVLAMPVLELLPGVLQASLELALRVAAPVLLLVGFQTLTIGIMSRTMPSLNIFSFGLPLRCLLGLGVLAAALPFIDEVTREVTGDVVAALLAWTEAGA